jgi:hypothetical protein
MDNKSPNEVTPHRPTLSVLKAILIGWLLVNVPALIIMLGILLIGVRIEPRIWWLFLLIGIVLGWTWWSFTVPRWRRWAISSGIPADRLQKFAVATGLTWSKGSIFEKTEMKLKD